MNKDRIIHIDGLRALAIVMIILFHLNPGLFSGGYFGVEIFLVISGFFLLKGYLLGELSKTTPGTFFAKKIVRLYPPLLVTLILTLAVTVCIYIYQETVLVADTGFSALFGFANIYLDLFTGGYFASDAFSNPLVHLWYLGVIMQAFVIFGIVIHSTQNHIKNQRTRGIILISIALISFSLNHLETFGIKSLGYYSVWTRLWIVAAGGAAALVWNAELLRSNTIKFIFCLIAIAIFSISLFNEKWLGNNTNLAIVASIVILICYGNTSFIHKIFRNKIAIWIGKASYSIYLCHMPIIVIMKYFFDRNYYNDGMEYYLSRLAIIPLILITSLLVYYFIEKRTYSLKKIAIFFISTVFIYFTGCITNGYCNYANKEVNIKIREHENFKTTPYSKQDLLHDYPDTELYAGPAVSFIRETLFEYITNKIFKKQPKRTGLLSIGNINCPAEFVVIGDSHAGAIQFGLHSVGQQLNWHGVKLQTYVIPAYSEEYEKLTENTEYETSTRKHELIFKWLTNHPEIHTIFIAQRWTVRYEDYQSIFYPGNKDFAEKFDKDCIEYFRRLRKTGKQIVILSEVPRFNCDVSKHVYKNTILRRPLRMDMLKCTKEQHAALNEFSWPLMNKLKQLNLCDAVLFAEPALEREGAYMSYRDGFSLMYDDDHLNSHGSTVVMSYLSNEFLSILQKGRKQLSSSSSTK